MTIGTGVITGISVAHENASIEEIEAACAETEREAVETLCARTGVEEAFCLQTCHRSERYVVTSDPEAGRTVLADAVREVPESAVEWLGHEASLEHLLRVAAGLKSVVLGEDQILGQFRAAVTEARGVGAIGPVLDEGLTKALHVGERARTETAINEGIVSLGSATARLATQEGISEPASALVIGAGETGTLAAEALAERVGRVLIANRTVSRATALADRLATDAEAATDTETLDTEALGIDELPAALAAADVVVSATGSPEPILDEELFGDAGETVVIDLARPRDIPRGVGARSEVTRYDLDALEGVIDDTHTQRRAAAADVEAMVESELARLLEQYKRKRADQVIGAMYESAESIKARELRTTFSKLDDLEEAEREAITAMADSLIGQLLAAPTESLREAAAEDDWTTINTALQLFDPDFGADPPESLDSASPEDLPEELRESMPAAALDRLED